MPTYPSPLQKYAELARIDQDEASSSVVAVTGRVGPLRPYRLSRVWINFVWVIISYNFNAISLVSSGLPSVTTWRLAWSIDWHNKKELCCVRIFSNSWTTNISQNHRLIDALNYISFVKSTARSFKQYTFFIFFII